MGACSEPEATSPVTPTMSKCWMTLTAYKSLKNGPARAVPRHAAQLATRRHAELEQGSNRQEDMRSNRYSNYKHDVVTITRYNCAG